MTDFLLSSDIDEIVDRLGDAASAFAGKTVLLTGGRGFLGRYFMEVFGALNNRVLEQPATIVAMDKYDHCGKERSRSA